MPTEEELLDAAIRQRLGLEPTGEEGLDVFQPVRTLFGATQGIGGRLAGALFPGELERAREEMRAATGVTPEAPWYEQVEAAPGLGDVLAQLVPEETRAGLVAQALGPVSRVALNIVGDPTSYTPFLAGRAARAAAAGVPAARTLMEAATVASKERAVARAAGLLTEEASKVAAAREAAQISEAVLQAGGPRAMAFRTAEAVRRGEPLALGTAAALAYGPRVVEATIEGAQQTMEAETTGEMLASGANTALMAGLGVMMAKGLISTGEAFATLRNKLREDARLPPETAAPEAPPPLPETLPGVIPETLPGVVRPEARPPRPAPPEVLGRPETLPGIPPEATLPGLPGVRAPEAPAAPLPLERTVEDLAGALRAALEGPPAAPRLVRRAPAEAPAPAEVPVEPGPLRIPSRPVLPTFLLDEDFVTRAGMRPGAVRVEAPPAEAPPPPRTAPPRTVAEVPEAPPTPRTVAPEVPPAELPEAPPPERAVPPAAPEVEAKAPPREAPEAPPVKPPKVPEVIPEPREEVPLIPALKEDKAFQSAYEKLVRDPKYNEAQVDVLQKAAATPEAQERLVTALKAYRERAAKEGKTPQAATYAALRDLVSAKKKVYTPKEIAEKKITPDRILSPEVARVRELAGEPGEKAALRGKPAEELFPPTLPEGEEALPRAGVEARPLRAGEVDLFPEAREVLSRTGETFSDAVARHEGFTYKVGTHDRRLGGDNARRFTRYLVLREQGLPRPEAIARAAKESGRGVDTERNFIGATEKAFYTRILEERGEQVPVVGAVDRTVLDLLRKQKQDLDMRIPVLTEGTPESFLRGLDKAALQGDLEEYARFAAARRIGRIRPNEFSDARLKSFAEDIGAAPVPRETTLDLLRKVSGKLGLDFERIKAAGAEFEKGVREGAEGRVFRLPGFEFRPVRAGQVSPMDRWVGRGGTEVRLPRGPEVPGRWSVEIARYRDVDGLKGDIEAMLSHPQTSKLVISDEIKGKPARDLIRLVSEDFQGRLVTGDLPNVYQVVRERVDSMPARAEDAARKATWSDESLTLQERVRRQRHYREDYAAGLDLGGGLRLVNHDRIADPGYVGEVGKIGTPAARVFARIVDDLRDAINAARPESRLDVVYRGLTASPRLSGLYHGIEGETGGIFSNLVEAVYAGRNYEDALEKSVMTLIHEATHSHVSGHGPAFNRLFDEYVKDLLTAQGKLEAYKGWLREALPEARYEEMRGTLVPRFREMWDGLNAESWRAEEAQPRVPAGPLESRASAQPYLIGRGATGPPGDLLHGLRPSGDVLRGAPGPAGELRPAAAPIPGAPPGLAQGEAVGRGARGSLAEERAFRDLSDRIESYTTRPGPSGRGIAEDDARRLLDELVESSPNMPAPEVHNRAWFLAGQIVDGWAPAKVAQEARSLPAPTQPGQVEGAINLLHMTGISDKTKAQAKVWYDLTKGKGLWARDRTRTWEEVGNEVQDLLGMRTPEEWAWHFRKRGGGLLDRDVHLLKMVFNELAGRAEDAKERWGEAIATPGTPQATIDAVAKARKDTEFAFLNSGLALADGLAGAARALAISRAETVRMDPRKAFEVGLLARLREKLSGRYRDKREVERRAQELLKKAMDIFESKYDDPGAFDEFRMAVNAMMGRGPMDKVLEFYKAGLIGWPSRVANITSNTMFRQARFAEDTVAAFLDWSRSKLTGAEREIYMGETAVSLLAMRRAFVEGFPEWQKATMRLFRLQGPDMKTALARGSMMEDLLQHGGAITGKLGNFIRFQLDGLGTDDAFAKHFSRMDTYYREVYRRLRKGAAGFSRRPGESFTQATERIAGDLRENHLKFLTNQGYDEAKLELFRPIAEEAEKIARTDTFQDDLGNAGRGFQSLLTKIPILQFVVPFVRTPTNIIKQVIKRTPAGFIEVAQKWKDLSPAERMTELSKPLTGSMMMAGIMGLASGGEITGGGPIDFEEQEALRATGWQPYSVRIGDNWVSYQRLEPVASLVGMAADWMEGIRQGDFSDFRSGAEKTLKSVAENITNKTFLSGLDGLTSAISRPNLFLGQFIKQMQGSLVPNSLGFVPAGHLARALDPVYRQTEPLSYDAFVAKIPFASTLLPPAYGPTGEERVRPGTALERLFLPFARQVAESGPKAEGTREMVRLKAVPRAPMRYWTSPQGYRVPLEPAERQALAKALDEAITLIGQRLMKDPSYLNLPDNELDPSYEYGQRTKKDVLEDIIGRHRRRALQGIKAGLRKRSREAFEAQKGAA